MAPAAGNRPSVHLLGVNFINVISAPFLYKSLFLQLFSSYMLVEKSCTKHVRTKNARVKC